MPPLPLPPDLWRQLVRIAEKAGLSPRGGEPLARAIAAASALYTGERGEIPHKAVDPDILAARLLFFAVRDFSKVVAPLQELAAMAPLVRSGARTLRVLDLGAGVGASGLGVARFAALAGFDQVELTAVDVQPEPLRVARAALSSLGTLDGFLAPVKIETRTASVERPASLPEGPFDVVIASFVLNELLLAHAPEQQASRGAELLQQFFAPVAPSGALLVLEPALKVSSRTLSAVRDQLVATGRAPHVVAPCLHDAGCPMLAGSRDWCHQELPLALPEPWAGLARSAGLRFEGLSYSYLTLRHQPRPDDLVQAPEGARRLRVVSDALVTKGKRELFGCGDGEVVRLTRLDREATEDNAAFGELARGDVFEVSGLQPKGQGLRVVPQTRLRRVRSV